MKRVLPILLSICLIAACLPLSASAATANTFTDINATQWYYPAVSYCLDKGLMSGMGADRFKPEGLVSRAQITQVLYNREGKPGFSTTNKFSDVKAGDWYANSVMWCSMQGIVGGVTAAIFAPNSPVTREQLCTMLYNYYTKHLGHEPVLASEEEMAVFTDYEKVSSWARDAVRWAVRVKVIGGKTPTTLAPKGETRRMELAQFLMNFDTVLAGGSQPKPTVEPSSTPVPTTKPSPVPTAPPADVFPLSIQEMPIAAGPNQTFAVNPDGTVRSVGLNEGGGLNVQGWTDIVAVAPVKNATVGLKSDGTVVCTGAALDVWKADIGALRNVVAVVNQGGFTSLVAALHSDGTVTLIDDQGSRKLDWTNIVQICSGSGYLLGLRTDGTVVATGVDRLHTGCMDVGDWTDIKFIAAGMYTTLGVKTDGTVVAAGEKVNGKANVQGWTDIVAVAVGNVFSVGLRSDGTVVGTGLNGYGQLDVEGWHDIVAISVNTLHTVGLCADGTVLATGSNGNGQCDVNGWTGIGVK